MYDLFFTCTDTPHHTKKFRPLCHSTIPVSYTHLLRHGKQTLRQLMKHNTGVSNIEITDQNIRAFSSTAKKYGLDFALKKDTSGEHTRYLVFFKGRDADVITAAFREFSAKNLSREKAPSIRRRLEKAQEQSKTQHKEQERGEKVKARERSVER